MSSFQRILLITGVMVYSVMVFILDVASPVGIEIWVLNVPLLVLPVFLRSIRLTLCLGLISSTMMVLGDLLSAPGNNPPSWDVLNRGMGLATVWLIALMTIRFIKRSLQLDDALGRLRGEIAERERITRALEQSEERLRLAMEGAGMGTFDVHLQTGQAIWSATLLRMFGYEARAGRQTTLDMWRTCVHPGDLERVLAAREQAMENRSAYSIEYRIQRADNGETLWLAVFGRHYYNAAGEGVRLLGVAFDVTLRKELERQAIQREVLAMTAREQRQIGQELHDGVGQELTGLGLMAQSLAERLSESAGPQRIAQRLIAGLTSVHEQVRELSRGLIPVHVERRGLAAALDELAARTAEATGIAVSADCPEWVELPDHGTATQLFRIAQEAVTNAVRHGQPSHIRVTLLAQPNGLRLRIRDDGLGIDDPLPVSEGLGIRIMHYRAGQIGGVLHVGPSQGGGTVVSCTLPRRKVNGQKECASDIRAGQNPDRG